MYTRRGFHSTATLLAGASPRDERLHADLQCLITAVERTHPSRWTRLPRLEFLRASDEFSASLPSPGPHAVVPGFARLVARISSPAAVSVRLVSGDVNLEGSHQDDPPPPPAYTFEFLPVTRTVIVQYRRCVEREDLTFADFTEPAKQPDRLIVDLRENTGGTSSIFHIFVEAAKRIRVSRPFALIGPATFSSAVISAAAVRLYVDR